MSVNKKKSSNLLDRITECDQHGRHTADISHLNLIDWPAELLIVPQVSILYAHKNNFTMIKSLAPFQGLVELDISRNFIVSLEGMELFKLTKLKKLDVSRNCLEHLHDDITQLTQLEVLMCHRNSLTDLPLEMKRMKSLRSLDISHNKVKSIGTLLELNHNLDELNITNNEGLVDDGNDNDIGPRARRLRDKRTLLSSKSERRLLITRALEISRKVLSKEQDLILNEYSGSIS